MGDGCFFNMIIILQYINGTGRTQADEGVEGGRATHGCGSRRASRSIVMDACAAKAVIPCCPNTPKYPLNFS